MKTPLHVRQLRAMGACRAGLVQAGMSRTFQSAWATCTNPVFMRWVVGRLAIRARGQRRAAFYRLLERCDRAIADFRERLPASTDPTWHDDALHGAMKTACIRQVCPIAPALPRLRKPKPRRRRARLA